MTRRLGIAGGGGAAVLPPPSPAADAVSAAVEVIKNHADAREILALMFENENKSGK